jgi:hypothetical protein
MIFFPHGVPRRVYEFLSFPEMWLDLRQMLLGELRLRSILFSGCALVLSALLSATRWLLRRWAPHLLQPPDGGTTKPPIPPLTPNPEMEVGQ